MTKLLQKTDYFWRCLKKRLAGQANRCPSCYSAASDLLAKKYLVSELRLCRQCKLLFRYPLDSEQENHEFYQSDYSQSFTTDCPSEPELKKLLQREFKGHEKDYSEYVAILRDIGLGPGSAVLDYGCSWGYGTWQLERAGFRTRAYEISEPRARYAREKLGIDVTTDVATLGKGWDCFFSAHVLEHVPSVLKVIEFARTVLRPGGFFVALTPNGSASYRAVQPQAFRHAWGLVHPNFISDDFYKTAFASSPLLLASAPYHHAEIAQWERRDRRTLSLEGSELLCIAVVAGTP